MSSGAYDNDDPEVARQLATRTANSFNKIFNQPKLIGRARSSSEVETVIKSLRLKILVDEIPSTVVCLYRANSVTNNLLRTRHFALVSGRFSCASMTSLQTLICDMLLAVPARSAKKYEMIHFGQCYF
jgi:hypothetical protein